MLKPNIITKENLLKVGVFDEFYDLYLKISDIALKEISRILENNNHKIFNSDIINGHLFSDMLREFFAKNTYLFTDKFKYLYLNSGDLNTFNIVDVKLKGFTTIIYNVGNFNFFLYYLEILIERSLFKRLLKDDPNLYYEKMVDITKNHFLSFDKYSKATVDIKEENILEISEVFVFKNLSNVTCIKDDHYVVTEGVKVHMLNRDNQIILPIHRCLECEKYFIGEESLKLYEKKYGHMILIRNYKEYQGHKWYEYAMESKLHSTGYNADNKTWTKKERQTLLIRLLETRIMTSAEIIRDLENSILRFRYNPRFEYAVPKWEEDLMFLNEYILKKSGFNH